MLLAQPASAATTAAVAPTETFTCGSKRCVSAWLTQHRDSFSRRVAKELPLRFTARRPGDTSTASDRKQKKSCRKCFPMAAAETQDFSRKVTIVNSEGLKLSGKLRDTQSKDIIVICHGFRSSKESALLSTVAEAITKTGTSTFQFDFTGNGESDGEFAYGNYWQETDDLRAVVLHWRAEGRHVSAILGHSKGGNVVVLYASKYGDVKTVVNVCGRFDLRIGIEGRFGKSGMKKLHEQEFLDVKDKSGNVEYRVTLQSLKDRLNTDMSAASRSISQDVKVFTVHGSVDETIDVGDAQEFHKRIPNHVVRIIEGANHNYEGKEAELCSLVVQFLQGNLSKI